MATTYATKIVVSATDNASGAIAKIGKAVTGHISKLAGGVRTLASGVAKTTEFLGNLNQARLLIAGAVSSAGDFIQGLADTGDELGAFADKTGLSVEAIQAWRYAAEQSDVETEMFNASIERFAVGLAAAKQGTGPLAAGLKKLSPALLEQLKKTNDTEEALGLYVAAMEQLPDASNRAMVAGIAFGKGNKDMALLAVQGSEALKKLREEKLRDGVVSTEQAKKAGEVDGQLKRLKSQYDGIKSTIGGALLPVLSPMLAKLSEWIDSNRTLIGLRLEATITAAGEAFGVMVEWLKKAKTFYDENITPIIDGLGGWGNVLVGVFGTYLVAALGSTAVAAASAAASIMTALAPVLAAIAVIDAFNGTDSMISRATAAAGGYASDTLMNAVGGDYSKRSVTDLASTYAATGSTRVYNALQDKGASIESLRALDAARNTSAIMNPVGRYQAIESATNLIAQDAGRHQATGAADMLFGVGKPQENKITVEIKTAPGVDAIATVSGPGKATVNTGARQVGTGAP